MHDIAGVGTGAPGFTPLPVPQHIDLLRVVVPQLSLIRGFTEMDLQPLRQGSLPLDALVERKRRQSNQHHDSVPGSPLQLIILPPGNRAEKFTPRRTVKFSLELDSRVAETAGGLQGEGSLLIDDAIDLEVAAKVDCFEVRRKGSKHLPKEPVALIRIVPHQCPHLVGLGTQTAGEEMLVLNIYFHRAEPVAAVKIAANADLHALDMLLKDEVAGVVRIFPSVVFQQVEHIASVGELAHIAEGLVALSVLLEHPPAGIVPHESNGIVPMVEVMDRYGADAMFRQYPLAEQTVILKQVATLRTTDHGIPIDPQTVLQLAEADLINHDQAVPTYPGNAVVQTGDLFNKPVQNLAVQWLGNKGANLVTLAMQAQTEADAGEVTADEEDFHGSGVRSGQVWKEVFLLFAEEAHGGFCGDCGSPLL